MIKYLDPNIRYVIKYQQKQKKKTQKKKTKKKQASWIRNKKLYTI